MKLVPPESWQVLRALILGLQRQHPLDRGDKAGGPDTGIPSADSPVPRALDGSAVSGASAGASCPDTEPPKKAPLSSAQTSGSLYLDKDDVGTSGVLAGASSPDTGAPSSSTKAWRVHSPARPAGVSSSDTRAPMEKSSSTKAWRLRKKSLGSG